MATHRRLYPSAAAAASSAASAAAVELDDGTDAIDLDDRARALDLYLDDRALDLVDDFELDAGALDLDQHRTPARAPSDRHRRRLACVRRRRSRRRWLLTTKALPRMTPEQRIAWQAARRHHLGASDVAAVIGLSPYATPWQVWADKARGLDVEETLPMSLGTFVEPWILDKYSAATGIAAWPIQRLVTHPNGLHAATPDAYDDEDCLVETKLNVERPWAHGRSWDWADGVPPWVHAQVQMQMACTGYERCVVAVYHPDTGRLRPRNRAERDAMTVTYDPTVVDNIVAATSQWWADYVAPWKNATYGRQPAIDGSATTKAMLAALYPEPERIEVTLDAEAHEALLTYIAARDKKAAATEILELAANVLRSKLANATDGHLPEHPLPAVTWRPDKNARRTLRVYAERAELEPHNEEAF